MHTSNRPSIHARNMTLFDAILLFAAGFVSSAVNAVAGGGTFLTFGAMSLVGVPPIAANATSAVTQFPGYVTSILAYWAEIRNFWRGALVLCAISVAGALGGSLILLSLDNPEFRSLVPWLLNAATALFAAGPWLKPARRDADHAYPQAASRPRRRDGCGLDPKFFLTIPD